MPEVEDLEYYENVDAELGPGARMNALNQPLLVQRNHIEEEEKALPSIRITDEANFNGC